MKPFKRIFLTLALSLPSMLFAGTDTFLTLLEPSSARATALGESFSAVMNDIGAFHYNPATLASLEGSQVSVLYENQFEQEKYSYVSYGGMAGSLALGGSFALFDTGSIALLDGEEVEHVSGQRDLVFAAGAATRFLHNFSWGLSPKWISTDISETTRIRTLAIDSGLTFHSSSRLNFGLSATNIFLHSNQSDEKTPVVVRVGSSYSIPRRGALFSDVSHQSDLNRIITSLGLEALFGGFALRGGIQMGAKSTVVSFGSGIQVSQFKLHYATNFIANKDLHHQFSVTYQLGGSSPKKDSMKNEISANDLDITNDKEILKIMAPKNFDTK